MSAVGVHIRNVYDKLYHKTISMFIYMLCNLQIIWLLLSIDLDT